MDKDLKNEVLSLARMSATEDILVFWRLSLETARHLDELLPLVLALILPDSFRKEYSTEYSDTTLQRRQLSFCQASNTSGHSHLFTALTKNIAMKAVLPTTQYIVTME